MIIIRDVSILEIRGCKQWPPTRMHTYPCIYPTYLIESELSLYEQKATLLHSLALFVV